MDIRFTVGALQPGPLDWLSGLVVPVLLGALTLFVAIWAGRIAIASNRLQADMHRETMATDARRRRRRYATELGMIVGRQMASRMVHTSKEDRLKALGSQFEDMQVLSRAEADADDPSTKRMTSWATFNAHKTPLDPSDLTGWMAETRAITDVLELWIDDPAAALAVVEADQEYIAAFPS